MTGPAALDEAIGRRAPVMLVLPGGGYESLAEHEGEPIAEWLRGLGWRAKVHRYPVAESHDVPLRTAPLDSVAEAVRNERRSGAGLVGVMGFSAGGHLAGHAALTLAGDARLDLAVLCYPVINMLTDTHAGSRINLLGPGASRAEREALSLQTLVTKTGVPMFVWSTDDDDVVPVHDHSRLMSLSLAAHGVDHEFHLYEGGGPHGIGLAPGSAIGTAWTTAVAAWLSTLQSRIGD